MTDTRRSLGYALLFGTLFVIVELIGGFISSSVPLLQVVWMRYTLHLMIVIAIWGPRGLFDLVRTDQPVLQLLRSLAALVMSVAWIFGFKHGDAPLELTAGLAFVPLFVLLLSNWFMNEHATARAWFAAALSALAGMILAYHYMPEEQLLAVLGPIAGACLALYIALSRALRHESVGTNMFYTALAPLIGGAFLLPSIWVTPALHDMPYVALVAGFGLVAWIAVDEMVRFAPLPISAALTNFQIIIILFGGLIAGTIPAYRSVGAAAALLLAALITALTLGHRSNAAKRVYK